MSEKGFVVEALGLRKDYYTEGEVIHALCGIDLRISQGEYLSLMGPSGSGKTTFLNLIGGLDEPTEGSVFIDGMDMTKLSPSKRAWVRRLKVGFIFQTFNLIPILSIIDNVALPMLFAKVPHAERVRRASSLLERVGLGDRLHHKPTELSVGQQQRVAIARALANNPSIILADEPTGSLDLSIGLEIVRLLRELNREKGVTIVCATHDPQITGISDRIIWIRDGQIEHTEKSRGLRREL